MATVETPNDLKLLPLRALVAYAARCARRVQPLYAIPDDHPDARSSSEAIDQAIALAEDFAAGRRIDPGQLKASNEAIVRALMVANEEDVCDEAAAYAANAAYAVVDATRAALVTVEAEDPVAAARKVVDSASIATDAAKAADTSVQRAARLDWEMLHRMHLGRFPEFGEPIDPSESGMLGPLFCGQPRIERKTPPAPKAAGKGRHSAKAGDDGPSPPRAGAKGSKSKKPAAAGGSRKVPSVEPSRQARSLARMVLLEPSVRSRKLVLLSR